MAHDTKGARNEAREGGGPGPGAVSGSAQWTDGARGVLHLSRGEGGGLLLAAVKSNYGPGGWGATNGFPDVAEWRKDRSGARKAVAEAGGGSALARLT